MNVLDRCTIIDMDAIGECIDEMCRTRHFVSWIEVCYMNAVMERVGFRYFILT